MHTTDESTTESRHWSITSTAATCLECYVSIFFTQNFECVYAALAEHLSRWRPRWMGDFVLLEMIEALMVATSTSDTLKEMGQGLMWSPDNFVNGFLGIPRALNCQSDWNALHYSAQRNFNRDLFFERPNFLLFEKFPSEIKTEPSKSAKTNKSARWWFIEGEHPRAVNITDRRNESFPVRAVKWSSFQQFVRNSFVNISSTCKRGHKFPWIESHYV